MDDWIRALGIDYGKARIGLAISDDLGLMAHPLETVPAAKEEEALARIAEIARDRKVRDVVIGLPLHLNGEEGTAVEGVRRFATGLQAVLPADIRFHEVDERLTTKTAMEKLHAAGRNEKNSRRIIDQAAAVEILQDWLDGQVPVDIPPPVDPW